MFRVGVLAVLAAITGVLAASPANAGCGCEKPPPPPAAVRPSVAYAGAPVALFSAALQAGRLYTVTFTSGTAMGTASVPALAAMRRDLADAVYKPQLVVPLPLLPLGPTRITVTDSTSRALVLAIDDASFTVAPTPLAVPAAYGKYHWPNFRAAVGRDGVAYVALDVSAVAQPRVFEARAVGYPLRFTGQDVVFTNVQGFLMQLLVRGSLPTGTVPIPGMFVFPATNAATDSDVLHYSRHEFSTYFLQHMERQPHALDPNDPNWHLDGTRHVDHDHLILEIMGHLNDGSLPQPGATTGFDLAFTTSSLFAQGVVGASTVTMSGNGTIDSFSRGRLTYGPQGDVMTNGTLTMSNGVIRGNATARSFNLRRGATITGARTALTTPATFMEVKMPALLPELGTISLSGSMSQTIHGPGSFHVSGLSLIQGSTLFIDNTAGPVTLYVTGRVTTSGSTRITVADPNPEKFAIYVPTAAPVTLSAGSSFYGVVYAPASTVSLSGGGQFFGAFVANAVKMGGSARVHYDSALRGN